MTAHLYWSLNVTAIDGVALAINELELRDTIGGINLCTGGTASATSVYADDATYNADKAFDGNTSSYWLANTPFTAPQRLTYQFASPVDIIEYVITSPEFVDRYPTDWTLEYSDDGVTWHVKDTIINHIFILDSYTFTITGITVDSSISLSSSLVSENEILLTCKLAEPFDYSFLLSNYLVSESNLNLSCPLVAESRLLLSVRPIEITDNAILFSSPLVNIQDSQLSMTAELLQYRLTDSQLTLSVNLEAEYQSLVIDIHNPETPVYGEYL